MSFEFKQFSVTDQQSSMKVGTDAVLLGVWAEKEHADNILEIGVGCGLISLMMAQRFPDAQIQAIDIHKPSVEEAKQNFTSSPWAERLSVENISLQAYTTQTKYDLIISNPPFFNDSLLPQTSKKTMAKHTGNLSHADLAKHASKLLSAQGKLSLILPIDSHLNFSTIQNGLHLWRQLSIIPKEGKTANRILSEWRMKKEEGEGEGEGEVIRSSLTIRSLDNNYTEEYIELTKAFYLALKLL